MGEVQLWQAEDLGTDKETLERVLRVFRSDGVQGIESQKSLESYIKGLGNDSLRNMYEIDGEATIQILVDCFGAIFAAKKYSEWHEEILRTAIDILQKQKETAEQEAEVNRAELLNARKVLNNEIDRIRKEYGIIKDEKEKAEERIEELQNALAHYKADLYDFYAQAGKVPSYR